MSWKSEYQKARRFKPAEVNQQICVDPEAADALLTADENHNVAKADAMRRLARGEHEVEITPEGVHEAVDKDPKVQQAKAALEAARARHRAASVDFTFRAMESPDFDALVAKHPPREGDKTEFNPATFKPALVAACHVYYEKDDQGNLITDGAGKYIEGDGMTIEEAEEIFRTWSKADTESLFNTALAVNVTSRVNFVALGKG